MFYHTKCQVRMYENMFLTTYDLGVSHILVITAGDHILCPSFLTRAGSPKLKGFSSFTCWL